MQQSIQAPPHAQRGVLQEVGAEQRQAHVRRQQQRLEGAAAAGFACRLGTLHGSCQALCQLLRDGGIGEGEVKDCAGRGSAWRGGGVTLPSHNCSSSLSQRVHLPRRHTCARLVLEDAQHR